MQQQMQQQMRSWILGLFSAAPTASSGGISSSGRHKSSSAPCSPSSTEAAAVISEPAQRRVSFARPPSSDGTYTLQLRGEQSCGAGGAALSSYVWAVIALPDKQLVFNSTGPASSVELKPGTYMVGLLVMDGRSNHAVHMRNITIPRVRLRDRLAGWGS